MTGRRCSFCVGSFNHFVRFAHTSVKFKLTFKSREEEGKPKGSSHDCHIKKQEGYEVLSGHESHHGYDGFGENESLELL